VTQRPRVYIQVGAQPPLAAEEAVQARVRAAGAEPFLIPPGGSTRVSWEELMEFDPQMVIYAVRGQGRAFDPSEFLGIEGWDKTEAAVMRRVYSCDAELFDPAAGRLDEGEGLLKGLLLEQFGGGSELESSSLRRLFQ
jgi:ABC-type Fe3+-hydroxamate transport system substrate-binding protein